MNSRIFHHGAVEHPGRQRRGAQRLAGIDVVLDPAGDLLPASGLPCLEGAELLAETPAHGEVDVARVVGNGFQMHGDVVEGVAEDGPEELRLRVGRVAQGLHALGRILFLEDAHHEVIGLAAAGHVLARGEIQALHFAADLLVEAGAGLLPQGTRSDELGQHVGRLVDGRKGIVGQRVLHGLDHVAHGVQAHHVGSAESAGLGAAELGAGEVVDHIATQAELLRLMDGGHHAEDADAVGDEVGRVLGAHHALAEGGDKEAFELVEDLSLGRGGRDQFDQMHVARRVEEMHAAEARLQGRIEAFGQRRDRQARGIGGEDRIRRDEGGDLLVQVVLPVHAFGDGLDDQVAALQQFEVVVIVGDLDASSIVLVAQRRRAEFFEALDGFQHDAVLGAGRCRQVEQNHGDFGIDAVGGDLRAHDAGAEDGDFPDDEIAHDAPLLLTTRLFIRHPGEGRGPGLSLHWIPAFAGMTELGFQNSSASSSSSDLAPARAWRISIAVSGSNRAK